MMNIDLWGFLSIGTISGVALSMFGVFINHRRTMKRLEVEALNARSEGLHSDAENEIVRKFESRIEALEKIVLDRKYNLDEKIKQL